MSEPLTVPDFARPYLVGAAGDWSCRQMGVLALAAQHPGRSLHELAAALGIARPCVSRACDRLVSAGLVHRVPHPKDGRKVSLTATDAGLELLGMLEPPAP